MGNKNGNERKLPVKRNVIQHCADLQDGLYKAQALAHRVGNLEMEEAFETARLTLKDAAKAERASVSVDVSVEP